MGKKLKSKQIFKSTCNEDGEIIENELTKTIHYDELGNVIGEEVFEEGELAILIENTYVGALLQKTQQTDYINQIQQIWEYKFDDQNRKIEKQEHFHTGGFTPTKYEYDDNGNLINEYTLDDENEVDTKITYQFDDKNNLLQKTEFDNYDFANPWISTSYKYNDNNNVIRKDEVFADQPPRTSTFEYDENGEVSDAMVFYTDDEDVLVKQKTLVDDDGNIVGMQMSYPKQNLVRKAFIKKNEKDKIIEEEILVNDNFNSSTKIEYNKNGHIVEEKYLNVVGNGEYNQWSAQTFELEYWDGKEEE